MQNATLNWENPRAPKPLLPGSHPNSAQGVGAAAREKGLQRIEGMKIAQSAVQGIGMSTKVIRGTWMNSPNYALAVSILFTRATSQRIMLGTEPGHVLSTSLLYNSLLHDSRFMQVPMSQAAPGDIIIEPTKNQADGYAGIVVDHGRIVSDSSTGVRNSSSLSEIERHVPPMVLFRYIGVQKYPGYTLASLANSGFNPDELRLPAGQPGGGQWTSGGAQSDGGGRRTAGLHGASDARQKPSNCGSKRAKSIFDRMQRWTNPDGSIIVKLPPDKGDTKDNDPKTAGQALGETGKSFWSGVLSQLHALIFPLEPDHDSSKPKSIGQIDKERNEEADGMDMTKPKGLGSAVAAGALITAGEALADGAAANAPKPKPSGLDATSEAKARVQANKDAYGGVDAQNMGKGQDNKASGTNSTEGDAATLKPYSDGGGHHVPAKKAFEGAPSYDPKSAPAIPNTELDNLKVNHDIVSGAQQTLYRAYAKTGKPLTWDAVQSIETQALVKGGMSQAAAEATVSKAISILKAAGVKQPTKIPWSDK